MKTYSYDKGLFSVFVRIHLNTNDFFNLFFFQLHFITFMLSALYFTKECRVFNNL